MIVLRAIVVCVIGVLLIEALMVELEKASPFVVRWGLLAFIVLFAALGFALTRWTSARASLIAAATGAIAYVTLGLMLQRYLTEGRIAWGWLVAPATTMIAAAYFFTLMAIGIGLASLRRWRTP